ncbi:hypothetical protein HAX54_044899 [Datura stramonium]|uniref:Uncharacterized protein n=1 Tax=Datura stramonium TaxID=4076 RepID=A0ABS8SPM2_DATST|nr:hypothetical protein [Datura stramonium]
MMKISSTKNGSGIGCVILLGGALITAAAMGSAFLISRNRRKYTKKITKKEGNQNFEDESGKGLHFLLPDSSPPCTERQQPSSSGTDKLCVNDNDPTSLFSSTPCLIQDGKPKLDEKRDTLNAIVTDHPKEEVNSPSFERLPEELELPETKISLLPDPDQELDEVSQVRIEVIQGNEEVEVLAHVHQAQATIFSNPALQMDNKREFLVHNDKGESNELQHTGDIETDNLEEGPIQEQEKQATGDQETIDPDGSLQETSTSNEHEPLNSDFELMKATDEDENKDHLQCIYFEEQCTDTEAQIDQFTKKCNLQMQFSNEEEWAKENDQANSSYVEATSENSPCRAYSIVAPNLAVSGIRNASIDDQNSAEVIQVIKETNVMDHVASAKQSLEAEHSSIQLVEKQSFQQNCQGNVLEEDNEASKTLSTDIEVVEKDLEANSKEVKDEVEESVFVYEEEEDDDDDHNNDIDKDDDAQEVEDDILEGARNSSEQSNSDKIWPADSNQELLSEHKEEKVKEDEEGTKIKEDETCNVENCNMKSAQNDFAITSCEQSNSTVNVIDSYRSKLMYLDDIAAITRGRRMLLGALLLLIWKAKWGIHYEVWLYGIQDFSKEINMEFSYEPMILPVPTQA